MDGHVAHMGNGRGFDGEIPTERYHSQDLGVDGRIILKWVSRNEMVR